MNKVSRIISILENEIELDWFLVRGDPFRVLITTLLSQRTRDENTDNASKKLFSRFKTPEELSKADVNEIEELIKKSGFYRVKAKRIKEISKILVEKYDGKVPGDIEELVKLPGIGYKTGACVMVYAFKKPDIPVDIHVAVIAQRLGWTKEKYPDSIRLDLMKKAPNKYWILLNELLVKFGQRICLTRKPLCYKCPIINLCPYEQKNMKSS